MQKKKLYILCACVLPLMICSGLVYSMFSLYMAEVLGAPKTQIGLIYMVGSGVGLLLGPVLGKMSDRFGRKPVIALSMAAFVAVFVLYSMVHGYLVVGPAFGGFLSDIIGSRRTFLLGAILVAIGLVLVLILVKEPAHPKKTSNIAEQR